MTVFRNSRYKNVKKYQIEDKDGNINLIYEPRDFPDNIVAGSSTHLIKAGETFESLAQQYYNDSAKWGVIADANPQIFFPLDLEAGLVIYIPSRAYAALV
jgi:nucleoid-associated protein YgaU